MDVATDADLAVMQDATLLSHHVELKVNSLNLKPYKRASVFGLTLFSFLEALLLLIPTSDFLSRLLSGYSAG